MSNGRNKPLVRGGARIAAVVLFLALLLPLQLAGPQSSLNILWRFVVLSYDNPATQALDELALEKTAFTDALEDVLVRTRLAASSPSRRLPSPAVPGFATSEALSGHAGRSPPLA